MHSWKIQTFPSGSIQICHTVKEMIEILVIDVNGEEGHKSYSVGAGRVRPSMGLFLFICSYEVIFDFGKWHPL